MEPKRKRGGGNNWIGLVIFLVIAFGSPVANFITGLIFQITGQPVSSNLLAIGMVALIVLAVAVSVISSVLRSAGGGNTGSETTLPTSASPQASAPPRPSPPPIMGGVGQQPTQFPGSPRFEPVINPRILAIGAIGLILFGGVFLAILALSGGI
ncbi:MAG: hypothetical protein WCI67_21110 [Chloroflexales bacterium]